MTAAGPLGRFNRAQRALFNWHEVAMLQLVEFMLLAMILPEPTLALAIVLVVGRVWMASGYTEGVQGRVSGFVLATYADYAVVFSLVVMMCRGFAEIS